MGARSEIKYVDKIFYISGQIDKSFREVASVIPTVGDVRINLKDLIAINSGGIREWVVLMHRLAAAQIYFFECSKFFIDQVNMVKNFVPTNGKIISFYVPFFSEATKSEKNILLQIDKHFHGGKRLPFEKVLDDQGNEMEIDIIEAKYFKFISG